MTWNDIATEIATYDYQQESISTSTGTRYTMRQLSSSYSDSPFATVDCSCFPSSSYIEYDVREHMPRSEPDKDFEIEDDEAFMRLIGGEHNE